MTMTAGAAWWGLIKTRDMTIAHIRLYDEDNL